MTWAPSETRLFNVFTVAVVIAFAFAWTLWQAPWYRVHVFLMSSAIDLIYEHGGI